MAGRTEHRFTPTEVTRTLWPHQPGARSLAERYGRRLVCVRYRRTRAGLHRYTTVELIIDEGPLRSSRLDQQLFAVRIPDTRPALIGYLRRAGAEQLDPSNGRWIINGATARRLKLTASAIKLTDNRTHHA